MFNFFNKTPSVPLLTIASDVITAGVGFIDVRTKGEYATGHAKGARNIPLDIISDSAEELKSLERVYVICQSGGRSAHAVSMLCALGVNAINVAGGTMAWCDAGLSME